MKYRYVKWKFWIAYEGVSYSGWESRKNKRGIEDIIKKIFFLLGVLKDLNLSVAGRTDSGVHGIGQIFSCLLISKFTEKTIVKAFNYISPKNIKLYRADKVNFFFNARKNAIGKRYIYKISNCIFQNLFMKKYVLFIDKKINVLLMQNASQYLLGKNDFSAFRSSKCGSKHGIRYIWIMNIKKNNSEISFNVKGNAFCYKMIRIIIGTLLKIGLGKLRSNNIKKVLISKNRLNAGKTLSSYGLILSNVYYINNIIK